MACFGEWRLTSGTLAGVMGVVGRIFRMAYGMDGTLCCFLNLRHLQYKGRCVSSLSDSVRMHAIRMSAWRVSFVALHMIHAAQVC